VGIGRIAVLARFVSLGRIGTLAPPDIRLNASGQGKILQQGCEEKLKYLAGVAIMSDFIAKVASSLSTRRDYQDS
jgi:hypothetical protein